MTEAAFIGGDWGTTRLRLFLCDGHGAVLARAEGPGAAEADAVSGNGGAGVDGARAGDGEELGHR